MKGSQIPSPIDIRMISNVRGLLEACLAEEAYKRNRPVDELDVKFTITDEKSANPEAVTFINCWLMSGNVSFRSGRLISSDSPFKKIPHLVCEVIEKNENDQAFKCPMFKSIPCKAINASAERIDGELDNFIRFVEISTQIPQWQSVANGTAIICHMSEHFA